MKRITSGIVGIDYITNGFPEGKLMLVTGDVGSGKTIFGLQFAKVAMFRDIKQFILQTRRII